MGRRGDTLRPLGGWFLAGGIVMLIVSFFWNATMSSSRIAIGADSAFDGWRPWILGLLGVQFAVVGIVMWAAGAELARTTPDAQRAEGASTN